MSKVIIGAVLVAALWGARWMFRELEHLERQWVLDEANERD
jgi:hypothetical protein